MVMVYHACTLAHKLTRCVCVGGEHLNLESPLKFIAHGLVILVTGF